MVSISKSEAINSELRRRLLRFVTPALIIDTSDPLESKVKANGTFTLLQIGGLKYLITAKHVWDGFKSLKDGEKIDFCVWFPNCRNPHRLSNTEPLDALGGSFDIALWRFSCDVELGKEFFPVSHPIVRIADGENAICIGFPGSVRASTTAELLHEAIVIENRTSNVDEHKFCFCDDDKGRKWQRENGIRENVQLGGISGCPAFRLTEDADNVQLEFAGIQYEVFDIHGDSHHDHALIRFQHGTVIKEDGRLDSALSAY